MPPSTTIPGHGELVGTVELFATILLFGGVAALIAMVRRP